MTKTVQLLSSLFLLICFSANLIAQSDSELQILKDMAATERKVIVADNLQLNEAESKLFWPIYNEYINEKNSLIDRGYAVLKKFSFNYETLTETQATEIMDEILSIQMDEYKLMEKYRKKMLKDIPPKTVFRFFQIENKLNAINQYELANEIPLVLKN